MAWKQFANDAVFLLPVETIQEEKEAGCPVLLAGSGSAHLSSRDHQEYSRSHHGHHSHTS